MKAFHSRVYLLVIIIFLISNLSCQKNDRTDSSQYIHQNDVDLSDYTPNDIRVIDGHIKTITKIDIGSFSSSERQILTSVGNNWNFREVETADYTFSNLKGYLIRNSIDPNLSVLVYINNGKFFKVFFKREFVASNIEKVTVTSPKGIEYMSFMLMDKKFLSHLKANEELPFKSIMSDEEVYIAKRQIATPQDVPPVYSGCQGLPFSDCMQCAISECLSDWKCAIMCGMGAELRIGTWTITCTFG